MTTNLFPIFLEGTLKSEENKSLIKFLPKEIVHKIWLEYAKKLNIDILVRIGAVDVIEELLMNNIFLYNNVLFDCATKHGNIKILELCSKYNLTIDWVTISNACEHGQLEALIWLFDNYSNEKDVKSQCYLYINVASKNNHIHILEWLHNRIDLNNFINPYIEAMNMAARACHLESVIWLRNNLDIYNPEHSNYIGDIVILDVIECACIGGDLEIIKFLSDTYPRVKFSIFCMNLAAGNGHIHVMDWIYENRLEFDEQICSEQAIEWAIMKKDIKVLRWLYNFEEVRKNDIGMNNHLYKTMNEILRGLKYTL